MERLEKVARQLASAGRHDLAADVARASLEMKQSSGRLPRLASYGSRDNLGDIILRMVKPLYPSFFESVVQVIESKQGWRVTEKKGGRFGDHFSATLEQQYPEASFSLFLTFRNQLVTVRLEVDGRSVLEKSIPFHDANPSDVADLCLNTVSRLMPTVVEEF